MLFKLTKAGNISRRDRHSMILNYCPFCGEKLKVPELSTKEEQCESLAQGKP